MTSDLNFARIFPPRPLDPAALEAFLRRLASDPTQARVVFESRSSRSPVTGSSEVSYWLGAPPPHLRWLRRTCRDLLPGTIFDTAPVERTSMSSAARVEVTPEGMSLATNRPNEINRAILSGLNQRLATGEQVALQIVLGARRSPSHRRGDMPDPSQTRWSVALFGARPATAAATRQVDQRLSEAGMATSIRVGVVADEPDRRRRLLLGVLGGISTAKSAGTFIRLVREKSAHFDRGEGPTHRRFAPSAVELVGLLGWPLGAEELPGLPPVHPKLLPVSTPLRSKQAEDRSFALSTVPGDSARVGLAAGDSLYHLLAIGPTGSGKSNAMLHLIGADIAADRAVLVIDPKRQLIDDIIERAVPDHRINDVVILDPSLEQVPGFNPLDVAGRDPDVVVDGLLAVFAAIFADGWGPRTQDIMHSTLLTLARVNAAPARHSPDPYTLLDVPRLLSDASFRRKVIGFVATDPALATFWAWYENQSPKAMAAAIAPVSNKLRQFLLRPAMRRVLGQPRPEFRLRDIFREQKIALVPLNEALIGPITAQLLGGLIVAETWMATMERANEKNPMTRPASVWIDEVQNYLHLPTSLDAALNASRSMGVGWHLAHQFRAQLPAAMTAAIDSNARNKIVFRPNDPKDAAAFARQTAQLDEIDFLSLGQYEAYTALLARGEAQPWCSVRTLPPPDITGRGDAIRAASGRNYGGTTPEPTTDPEPVVDVTIGRKRRGRQV